MGEQKTKTILTTILVGLAGVIVAGLFWFFFSATSAPTGLSWYIFSFASGLTMIVLPCTLPLAFVIVPLSMKKGLLKGIGIALSFGLGVAITLSMYGVLAAVVGKLAIGALEVELETVKNWVYLIAGIFTYLFALGEIGLLKIRMPSYTGSAPGFIQRQQDYIKALMLGLFLGNIGVGCPHPATPLLLVEIASSGNVIYGWALFLVHAIGRIAPLLFLSFLGILGINGLSWIVARKDKVEKATGWAMVFVAGFILVFGLFTHDWYVNSGIHSQFETLTQEERITESIRGTLASDVTHAHGVAEGPGLFGLPLALGNWVLVLLWITPIWIWWYRKKRRYYNSPAVRMLALEEQYDKIEHERRELEKSVHLDALTKKTNLAEIEEKLDALEKERRDAEMSAQFGETDRQNSMANPLTRQYEKMILFLRRNFLIVLTLLIALVFLHLLPHNFLKHTAQDHSASEEQTTPTGTQFSRNILGLPKESDFEIVTLNDGDTYDIEARIIQKKVGNRVVKMLAYNGHVPGPLIKVTQGAEITLRLTNNTDIESTLHSHGVRVDNRFDGVPFITQDPIAIGETFEYTVRFPDAGIYWYHPHIREDYAQEHGLYGNYVVTPLDSDYWSPVDREIPLLLDDILLDENGISPFYNEYVNFALLGRFGNEYLVNGETDFIIDITTGDVVRFPITNVASVRPFNLSIPGARMKLVGADISKYERERFVENILITPAERAVIEVYFGEPGLYKLTHTTPMGAVALAYFRAVNNAIDETDDGSIETAFNTLRVNKDVVQEIDALRKYFDRPADKHIELTVDLGTQPIDHTTHGHGTENTSRDHGDASPAHHDNAPTEIDHSMHSHTASDTTGSGMQWNDATHSDITNTNRFVTWKIIDTDTGRANMDINWRFKVGDIVKVSIFNNPMADHVMQHPIHFHGQRFLVLSRNGTREKNMAWKDTVHVLPNETIELLVEMSNSGEWMAHCHIAEHLHSGMMFGFRVEDKNGSSVGDEYRRKANGVDFSQGGFLHEQPPTSDSFGVSLKRQQEATTIVAGQTISLNFDINGIDANMPIQSALSPLEGGEYMRVFMKNGEGDSFAVLYPNSDGAHTLQATHRFNTRGTYSVWSMVKYNGNVYVFAHPPLMVSGDRADTVTPKKTASNIIVGDYQVELSHNVLNTNVAPELQFVVKDIFGGGVELETFADDVLHVDLFRDDLSYYEHLHPDDHIDEHVDDTHDDTDGHDHSSRAIFIQKALAHGTIEGSTETSATYAIHPKPFQNTPHTILVHFRPANVGLPADRFLTATFNLNVPSMALGSITSDDHDAHVDDDDHAHPPVHIVWYMSIRWWILFLVSSILMIIFSFAVRKYLRVNT